MMSSADGCGTPQLIYHANITGSYHTFVAAKADWQIAKARRDQGCFVSQRER